MAFRVVLPKRVQKDLEKIELAYRDRIIAALMALASDPYAGKKLGGEHKGEWSCRGWPYRIIYRINKNELIVLVVRIGHRQGVY